MTLVGSRFLNEGENGLIQEGKHLDLVTRALPAPL